ncbi:MAG: SDR family NAD(P)-dependent oxidoreductase [Planctomycetota bacterium]
MAEFTDRTVIVTGGCGALGTAVAGHLLKRGARVAIPAYSEKEVERFEHASNPAVTIVIGVDLTDEAATESFYSQHAADGLWASIHVAGGFAMSPLGETSADEFDRMMAMNTRSCFLCCRHAAARMGPEGGRLVNVAARVGLVPEDGAGMAPYTASKAAVAALTMALGTELKGQGIWVNAVAPSIMDTEANRAAMPAADHDDWPSTEDVAETICFLASPGNKTTRSAVVPVYGRS